MRVYIYIYIYSRFLRVIRLALLAHRSLGPTPNPPTNIVDFGGFDSSTILILRGGILMSIGDFPESSSRAMLVGTMLVGRLGV